MTDSPMTEITFFTQGAVEEVAALVEGAESPADAVALLNAAAAKSQNTLTADFIFAGPAPDLAGDHSETLTAGELAKRLYLWLGPLTPVEASDNRLWSYLSCVTFQDFTSLRWPLDTRKWKNRFKRRWLMSNASRDKLVRNSISRLWWAAHLTHDPDYTRPLSKASSDPFAYTHELLRREDAFLGLADRDLAGCPDLLNAILDHFADDRERASEDYIRGFLREIVLVSGYTDIAGMTHDEAQSRIESVSSALLRQKHSSTAD